MPVASRAARAARRNRHAGHTRIELSRFLVPEVVADHRAAPVNSLGYLRVMFAVSDLVAVLERLGDQSQLLGEIVDYQGVYRLCYIRGRKAY